MKILMTEQNAYIEMDGSMPLLILESWMSIMHNIPYEVSTYRRGEKCSLDWKNGKNAHNSLALIFSIPQDIQMHHSFFPKTFLFCYNH